MSAILLLALLTGAAMPFDAGHFASRLRVNGLIEGARPVAKAYRGPLDAVDVRGQSVGVLARFAGADRATAERALTEVTRALGLADAVRVSFIRTDAGPLAALSLDSEGARLTFSHFTALALKLSARAEVAEAYAFVTPGPRDDSLEQEAFFRFERGEPRGEARAQYRDDPRFLEHVRRKTSAAAFHAGRWPDYPLSQLAAKLQLPGRACLDSPWQLQTLATTRWPIDAGENLALAWVDLPGGIATEIQQAGLKAGRSPSSVVAEALISARDAKQLAEAPEQALASYDEGQPDSEKQARRSLTLFLPADLLEAAEDSGGAEAISISRVVQYAWRRAHPVVTR